MLKEYKSDFRKSNIRSYFGYDNKFPNFSTSLRKRLSKFFGSGGPFEQFYHNTMAKIIVQTQDLIHKTNRKPNFLTCYQNTPAFDRAGDNETRNFMKTENDSERSIF